MTSNEPRARGKRDDDILDEDLENKIDDEEEDDEITKHLQGEAKCKARFFNCIGNVAKGSLHYLNEPEGLTG